MHQTLHKRDEEHNAGRVAWVGTGARGVTEK